MKKLIKNSNSFVDMDIFLDELKASAMIALSVYKENVFARDYPVRDLYESESEYKVANLEFTLAYIERIKQERYKMFTEILAIYYMLLNNVKEVKYNKEEEKYEILDTVFDIKKMIVTLISFNKNKKNIQKIDKFIAEADNFGVKINEMINWLMSDNEVFNSILDNLKERANDGEDILWKLLNLTMPDEEDTIENDRKKIPIVKR